MDQNEFCQKLKPFAISSDRASRETEILEPKELTGFRAILGGLLWLCQTRLDIIADVVLQQQEVARATIGTLKLANSAITKAKRYSWNCGLYFPSLAPPLKIGEVCDSSHATKTSSYAQEACLILLMPDKSFQVANSDSPHYKAMVNGEGD